MTIFAIFMCLVHAHPGIGRNCIMVSEHPTRPQLGVPYEQSFYWSLQACRRDMPIFERGTLRGYTLVCMKQTVPAWEEAQ